MQARKHNHSHTRTKKHTRSRKRYIDNKDEYLFSGYGDAVDYINGDEPYYTGAIPIHGTDFMSGVGEPDEITGRGEFQIFPVGVDIKYPHFKLFYKNCPFCRMIKPKVESMISVFERLGIDIPVYEVNGDEENRGNEIIEAASDITGYPVLRYFSKDGMAVTYEHGSNDEETVQEFIENVMKMMSIFDRDTTIREKLAKMNKELDKIVPDPNKKKRDD